MSFVPPQREIKRNVIRYNCCDLVGKKPLYRFKLNPTKDKKKIIRKLKNLGIENCKKKYLCWFLGPFIFKTDEPLLFNQYARENIKFVFKKLPVASWYCKTDFLPEPFYQFQPIESEYLDYFFNYGEHEKKLVEWFLNRKIDFKVIFNIVPDTDHSLTLCDTRWFIEKIKEQSNSHLIAQYLLDFKYQ